MPCTLAVTVLFFGISYYTEIDGNCTTLCLVFTVLSVLWEVYFYAFM